MSSTEFRQAGHELIDWIADYLEQGVQQYPVRSTVQPGAVRQAIEAGCPGPQDLPETWDAVWADVQQHVLTGVTHWQSPRFFAYFPANVSYPAILGELLSAGLGVNGMMWATSPAATELETLVLDSLVDLMGLPQHFKGAGVIQDTASSASLCAVLCAREQTLDWDGNEIGLARAADQGRLMVYVSDQAHSSIEKAVKIAGLGRESVRIVPSDTQTFAMDATALSRMVADDLAAGRKPAMVCATLGTTSSLAIDPIAEIGRVCQEHGIWFHVDGAMAGSALICPEFRHLADGLDLADSYCFNPHKWLFTNFDCDVFYVRQPERLIRTLTIMPEYLKTAHTDDVINYRDWHVPLGRRFRSLKLWFVLRLFGVSELQRRLRNHIEWASQFAQWVESDDRFELVTRPSLGLVCFGLKDRTNDEQEALLNRVNETGRVFLSHTVLSGRYVLRMSIGQTNTTLEDVKLAWHIITDAAGGS
ncbi:MAG: aspartate aminotransferase family protein [Planctomycetes bacterium]|nr:aspartate aminotransferase family protein [Planctomycetota bacterium]NOG53253.1 aspartate aminotransferase family protein [Planctomycetota bacterium]